MIHVAPLSLKAQLFYLSAGAALSLLLSLVGLLTWRSMAFFRPAVAGQPKSHGYTPAGMTGLITFFTFAGLSVALLVECSHYGVRYAFHPSHTGREWLPYQHGAIGFQLGLGLFFFLTGVVSYSKWGMNPARCGYLFCLGVDAHPSVAKARGDSFSALLSILFVISLVPLALVLWYRAYTYWLLQEATRVAAATEIANAEAANRIVLTEDSKAHGKDNSGTSVFVVDTDSPTALFLKSTEASIATNPMAKPPSMRTYTATPWKKQLSRILGLCAGIIACALVTFWLPNDPRKVSANGIANYAQYSISRDTRSANTTVPEMPYAWFRTSQIRVSPNLFLKLFPGNVFFYVYLLSMATIVFVLRQTQTGRYWMQRRIPQCACFTYGEAAFVAATAWLVLFFTVYWIHDHNYKQGWTAANPVKMKVEKAERWGRGLGQLAILFLSLLLLPVGRQSVVVTVLGVSRDGLLWFHRAVGYAMLAATLGHIIAFYVSYYEYGLLWANLRMIPNVVGRKGVLDDYTIVAATWTTWFLLIAMGVFGLNAVRRRYYELFYYTHLAATYMTLPMMVFHAAAGWMYMLPGATVFLADQLVRVWQRSAVVRVVHARAISEDTVELAFSVPGRWDMRRVHPGQYVLVCVPELTALQWHPFTLTSVADDEAAGASGAGPGVAVSTTGTVFHVHVKSMGPGTWTGRLYAMVRAGQPFSMGVEGPCGTPVHYSRYDDVVLVAGGIGAAPCVSVYGSLLRSYMRSADGLGVPRVRMVWSTRSASLVGAVADMLQLPVSYRSLVRMPAKAAGRRSQQASASGSSVSCDGGRLELEPGCAHKADAYVCDIYVTRDGELEKFAAVVPEAAGGGGFREEAAGAAAETRTRGGRLRLHQGRPDVGREIAATLTNPATGEVRGDVTRKLVLVCGPEGLVSDAVKACAALGVAVHTEEFLF